MENMELIDTLFRLIMKDSVSPKCAAFIIHAIIEMIPWESDELKKEFKNLIIEIFNSDVENGLI